MERVVSGRRTDESQFQTVPATSGRAAYLLRGACGPNALAKACRWADQSITTPSTVDVYRAMRGLGLGADNGVANLWDLEQTARKLGYGVILPNAGESVAAFIARMSGVAALVWETANGQALRDFISGYGEDATNLQYHFVCRFGHNSGGASSLTAKTLPAGAWHGDGDSDNQNMRAGVRYHWPINERLQFYTDTVISAARPIGAFAIAARRVASPGGPSMAIPTGWKDASGVLTAPNGVSVVKGFRDYVLAFPGGWNAANTPRAAEHAIAGGSRQDFRYGSLVWTPAANVQLAAIGDELASANSQLAVTLARVASLQAQLAEALAAQKPADPDAEALAQAVRKVAGVIK